MLSRSGPVLPRKVIWTWPGAATELSWRDEEVEMAKKRRMGRDVRVTQSTGNVFRDLGFSEDESAHLLVRSDLMIEVQKFIAARRLTQAQVAKILHVTQPRVSDLLRGRVDLFSTDTLLDMLGRLGVQVRFVLKPSRRKLQVA
jgi:predicted XRE-type DNA-binding protein